MHSRLSDNEIVFKHCYLDIVDGNRTPSPLKNRLNSVRKKCIKTPQRFRGRCRWQWHCASETLSFGKPCPGKNSNKKLFGRRHGIEEVFAFPTQPTRVQISAPLSDSKVKDKGGKNSPKNLPLETVEGGIWTLDLLTCRTLGYLTRAPTMPYRGQFLPNNVIWSFIRV